MFLILSLLLTLHEPAFAKSTRTIQLSEGDMAPIFVEPGYSTLLRFDSHPEPGLIGDQDSFKVEYMRNMVAIKPLIFKGKTNLFIFTKEGQFGFQLIASRGKHDDNVYVQRMVPLAPPRIQALGEKVSVPIEELLLRKINKAKTLGNVKLTLESLSQPPSKSTLLLKFSIQQRADLENIDEFKKVAREQIVVSQSERSVPIENIYLEVSRTATGIQTNGLILIRTESLSRNENLTLTYLPVLATKGKSRNKAELSVATDLSRL